VTTMNRDRVPLLLWRWRDASRWLFPMALGRPPADARMGTSATLLGANLKVANHCLTAVACNNGRVLPGTMTASIQCASIDATIPVFVQPSRHAMVCAVAMQVKHASGHPLSGRELFRSRGLPPKMVNKCAVYQASKAPIRMKVAAGDARLS
jgi:hypothetical protein